MAEFDATELSVCTVCIHLLANGEFNDGTDAAEVAGAGMRKVWGDDVVHLIPACGEDCEGGFSWSSCDGCGSNLGGDRHKAVALIPAKEDA